MGGLSTDIMQEADKGPAVCGQQTNAVSAQETGYARHDEEVRSLDRRGRSKRPLYLRVHLIRVP